MSILLDILGPRKDFEGGLYLPDFKSVSAKRAIQKLPVTAALHVPLCFRPDLPTTAAVAVGDRVLRGQRLAIPQTSDGIPSYAPTSGRIDAFEPVETVADGALPGVVLLPDGRDEAAPPDPTMHHESFLGRLMDRAVVCVNPRQPAHVVLQRAIAAGVTDLIINGMETEPYLTADLRTLVEEPGLLIDTVCEIADAVGVVNVYLAVPYRHRRVVKRLEAEAAGRYVEIAALSDKYPQCHPTMLIKTLLDREVPPGGGALDTETLVLPLSTVRAMGHALWHSEPMTHVLMTVAGDAVDHAGTYRVAIGTPLRELAERVGQYRPVKSAVWGGPFTGLAVTSDQAVVTADTIALLLFAEAEEAPAAPCVHCGWCVEDCPVGLSPTSLIDPDYARRSTTYAAEVNACIDCGLCTYVCPSKLPLAETIRAERLRLKPPSGNGKGSAR
ncbi:MAG: electron transport complex subunit C [Phycisphaerae bacterium]|nr:MAG: 4Fe-4S dicluster domain-containing protein [Planctomycetia bacterium]RIK71322.1 MAG: hypothetical protein DCC66_01665 [Planctomycetota bacterium]GJQ26438.1 MAG: electron transport complex subunit C [Phycisphaerae bacterium]